MGKEKKRKFKFYMTDELGNEFSFKEKIGPPYEQTELEYILEEFKRFLLSVGYTETSVSRIQYLDDEEWKYVLTKYGEWDSCKEEIYNAIKMVKNANQTNIVLNDKYC